MPLYTFEHPISGDVKDIFFHMNDDKAYADPEGVQWSRVWHAPTAAIDSNPDPFSANSFLEKTNNKGTYGELEQRSKDMSEKRKDKLGYDPIKQKYFKDYSRKRNGTKHHLDRGK